MTYITNEKRYNTVNNYYRYKYGKKVFKVPLNAGFTCPNKDGKTGIGGCIYCSKEGSGDFAGNKTESITTQFLSIRNKLLKKWPDAYYIPYFQANSNTYSDTTTLRKLYYEALSADKKIVGLSIATRCDCFNNEIYDLLSEINKITDLTIELGLQTTNPHTTTFINRGHDLACFHHSVKELKNRNIKIVAHIINGLPNETKDDMLNTVKYLNKLDIDGIKIHLLHIMKETALGDLYLEKPFKTLSFEEYIDITVSQIEILKPSIIIHRLTGDAPKDLLIEPIWSLKKFVIMNEIDKLLRKKNTYQGIYYKE